MTQLHYDLAELIPGSLSAHEASRLLTGIRDYFARHQTELPGRQEIDQALREVAAQRNTPAIVLFQMLRVVVQWPLASPGLFDVIVTLGPVEVVARLDNAIRRFSDVA